MTTKEKFGQNLKKVRNSVNLTQKQIVYKAGIHINYYARVERGEENPSFEVLERIIKALKIKSSEVMPF